MSYRDTDSGQDRFDVRSVDLLKIKSVIDLEIVIAEADFCLKGIERQILEGFDGPEWQRSALRAKDEIEHKKRLAMLKLVASQANAAAATKSLEDSFKTRFLRTAAAELAPDVYSRLYAMAGFKGDQT